MNQLQIETQGIERQLTPEELEAIAGGGILDALVGKLVNTFGETKPTPIMTRSIEIPLNEICTDYGKN